MQNDGEYDWGNTDLPFLDIKGANAFDPEFVDVGVGIFTQLGHLSDLTLLKIKMLLDLMALQHSAGLPQLQNVPTEFFDAIRSHMPRSPIIAKNKKLMERQDHTKEIRELASQVRTLHGLIQNVNRHFWHIMFNPEEHLTARSSFTSRGTVEDV